MTVSARGRLTTRRWPACNEMPPLTPGPLTTTWPRRSRSSNRSLAGSHETVKTVPLTVTRKGPASTSQRCARLCVIASEAVPSSIARCAPSSATERSRPRVPAASANVLPSLKSTLTPATPDCERYPPSSSVPPSIRETLTGGSGGSPRSCPTGTNLTAATRQTADVAPSSAKRRRLRRRMSPRTRRARTALKA